MVGARGQRFGAQKRLVSRKRILMLVPYITLGAHAGAGLIRREFVRIDARTLPTMSPDLAWNSSVPLRIALDGRDDATPLYLLHPRVAPLAAIASRLRRHFRRHLEPQEMDESPRPYAPSLADSQYFSPLGSEAWAEADEENDDDEPALWFQLHGAVVRWDIPLGAALDALGRPTPLPIDLTLHIGRPPSNIAALDASDDGFRAFVHSLKQAAHLERGTARSVLTLALARQRALYAACSAGDLSSYEDLEDVDPKRVPCRVFVDGCSTWTQLPFAACNEHGAPATVGEALGPCVRRALSINDVRRATAVCHGVELPWDCVLVDAWRALRCGDHFLYVAVRLL